MIEFLTEDVVLPSFLSDLTKRWIDEVICSFNKEKGDINYLFCSDEQILKVNQKYLDHDYYTDIITFDYCNGMVISGDLIISLDTVKSNSDKFNTPYNDELHRVMIHGILHLIGFKDATEDEKVIMRQEEDKALSLLSTFH
ncbi:rRNA maturation RNase YbeY [Carboxylicivirga sp. RSCT41]|uniref:rRNA maturation RNase YbeY n=1 Tax=Carboxylicivirga agarovorans TaxID=3417570 RepID=UPI003D326E7A